MPMAVPMIVPMIVPMAVTARKSCHLPPYPARFAALVIKSPFQQ